MGPEKNNATLILAGSCDGGRISEEPMKSQIPYDVIRGDDDDADPAPMGNENPPRIVTGLRPTVTPTPNKAVGLLSITMDAFLDKACSFYLRSE